jgi:hypothetical protein
VHHLTPDWDFVFLGNTSQMDGPGFSSKKRRLLLTHQAAFCFYGIPLPPFLTADAVLWFLEVFHGLFERNNWSTRH